MVKGSKRVKSSRRDGGSLSTSLAGRALKVLVGWNKEGVQAESATLKQKPAVEHVYTLFWECLGTGNADAEVRGIYMNAEAGNDAALTAGGIEYEDLYDDNGTFDRDGCLTLHFEGDDAPFDDVWTVRKQRLRGSVPSAAPRRRHRARSPRRRRRAARCRRRSICQCQPPRQPRRRHAVCGREVLQRGGRGRRTA
eukprot:TRINITY_DN5864_c0_g1_i1.p1 TRINITY_DN5864_c0_g1~~TRINITY_DN5864_c0_g1_i1.p1  ORF type:complete len:195 (-),score=29.10 TRINITY_DN5864_c0_g1_i1:11-595(-)